MATLTIEQAIEAAYAADTPGEAKVASDALEAALKADGIRPEEYPDKAPEALGLFEMLEQLMQG